MMGRKKAPRNLDDETPSMAEDLTDDVQDAADDVDAHDTEFDAELDEIRRERDEAVEQYKRALADYRNFQRRSSQNEIAAAEQARQDLVRDLIPVLDNFELALGHAEESDPAHIIEGVKMVRDALMQALVQRNLQRIAVEPGDEFDPNQHEALMMEPTADVEPNHVVRLIQVGYALGDMVLRPAKVSIAQPMPAVEADANEDRDMDE